MKKIPWLLIYLRLALTIPAALFGYYKILGTPYVLLLAVAAATDYFDGVIARKMGVETARLRQWDSVADTIFFIGVLAGMWLAYPDIYKAYSYGILAIIGLEMARYVVDLTKFKKGASYHSRSAKLFGVSLLVATIAIMGAGVSDPFLTIALVIGIISEMEGLAMSLILKDWTYNVRHIGIAIKIRKEQMKSR